MTVVFSCRKLAQFAERGYVSMRWSQLWALTLRLDDRLWPFSAGRDAYFLLSGLAGIRLIAGGEMLETRQAASDP